MKTWNVALAIGIIFVHGCDSYKARPLGGDTESAESKIHAAQESLMQAQRVLEEFPRLDVIIRTTREYVILRQVEISESPIDMETWENLSSARSRADRVLSSLACFSPMIGRIERALLQLRGALYQAIESDDLFPGSRGELSECRRRILKLLDDLQLAQDVLNSPGSVYPDDSDYYDPDFHGVLRKIESTLKEAGEKQAGPATSLAH